MRKRPFPEPPIRRTKEGEPYRIAFDSGFRVLDSRCPVCNRISTSSWTCYRKRVRYYTCEYHGWWFKGDRK